MVFSQINNLKNWENWSTSKKYSSFLNYSDQTSDENSYFTWEIEDLDSSGKIQNKSIKHYANIEQEAFSKKLFGKTNYKISWNLNEEKEKTIVSVKIKGKLDFWAKALNLITQENNKENLEQEVTSSLNNLKEYVYQKMQVYAIHVDGIKNTAEKSFIYTSLASENNPQEIISKREIQLQKLRDFSKKYNLKSADSTFIVFNKIDKKHQTVILSFCQPIKNINKLEEKETHEDIFIGSIESQKTIKSTLKGDYKNIPKLWEATKTYMVENSLKQDSSAQAYEIHKITEKDSKNPADWVTELYIPIQEKEKSIQTIRK